MAEERRLTRAARALEKAATDLEARRGAAPSSARHAPLGGESGAALARRPVAQSTSAVQRVDQLAQPAVVDRGRSAAPPGAARAGRCRSARGGTAMASRIDPDATMSLNSRLSSASSAAGSAARCRRSTSRSPTQRHEW